MLPADTSVSLKRELGNFKMFEFVRIRNVKNSEVRSMKENIRSLMTSSQSTNSNLELTNEESNQNLTYGVPKKRSGHRAVCNNENLWIWGGYCPIEELEANDDDDENTQDSRSPLFPELWRFNFSTRRWSLLTTTGDAPSQLVASHSAVLLGDSTLVVFGGTGFPFGENLSNSLYTCNLNTLVWKKYDIKGQPPLPLYGSSLLIINDYLYILFGTNALQYCSNVYRINMKTLESVKLFDSIELIDNATYIESIELNQVYPEGFLYGRYRQEVIHYNQKLYTFGGGKIDGDAHSLENLPAFNLLTNKWEFIQTLPDIESSFYPEKRKFHSCIKIDDFVYVFGGMYCNPESNVFRVVDNYVWRINMRELRWKRLNIQMPCLTYFHAACANQNGQVYIHGGVKTIRERDLQRVNHLYTILFKIPKLSDICWTKLITNYPNILYLNKKVLFNMGVPSQYINKIN